MTPLLCLILLCLCHEHLAKLHGNIPLRKNIKINPDNRVSASPQLSLNFCAAKCIMYSDCLSFSYSYQDGMCELYSMNSTTADGSEVIETTNVVLIDIQDWPQGKLGVCSDKPCSGADSLCVPDGQSFYCGKREQDKHCPHFPLPEHGWMEENKEEVLAGEGILVGCLSPYLTTMVDRNRFWYRRCPNNGIWDDWTYTCYTVAELCVHPILEGVNIAVRSGYNGGIVVDGADMLLSAKKGVAVGSFLEIKFLDDAYWIGGVSTKGGNDNQWVVHYRIMYASTDNCDETDYTYINAPNTMDPKVFPGNTDASTEVQHTFEEPIAVSCLRIYPVYNEEVGTMRVELLWCKGTI